LLAKLKGLFAGTGRSSEKDRLAAIEKELAEGWSYPAYDELRNLSNAGYAGAQYRLGQMFERAEGVVQNLADAVHWYRLAADQNFAPAQARLGLIFFIDPPAAASISPDELDHVSSEESRPGGSMLERSFPRGFAVYKDYAEAARWNKRAAEQGVAEAQARLGQQYALGAGLEKDMPEAKRWFTAAAEQGDAAGQAGLGVLYTGDFGTKPDYAQATAWLTKAIEAGNPTAQYRMASLLLAGKIEPDPESAIVHLRSAANQEHVEAMHLLGVTLWQGQHAPQDLSAAESLLVRAANRGHVDAAFDLGRFLLERDQSEYVEAAKWLQVAAEHGHLRAAGILGELYLSDTYLPQDAAQAQHWLEIGESESNPEAFTSLAKLYVDGTAVDQDYAVAAYWLRLAAGRGSVSAHFNLGSLHRSGLGVPEDHEEAERCFRQAGEQGNAEAAFHLGLLHSDEHSPLHDPAAATAWFARAADLGHDTGRYNYALSLIEGIGVETDTEKGIELLETVAGGGSVTAAEALSDIYASGKYLPPSPEQTAKYLAMAIRLGSVPAAEAAADLLQEGSTLPLDAKVDLTLLQQAAADGDLDCQRALGRLYAAGLQGTPDLVAARSWFQQAANAGDPQAQAWMGDCCRQGLIDPPDWAMAEWWYRRAAEQNHTGGLMVLAEAMSAADTHTQETLADIFGLWLAAASNGNAIAQRQAGLCYLYGKGCPEDPVAAVRWFTAAAGQDDAEAAYELSQCYAEGRGVRKNEKEAAYWGERATQHGLLHPATTN
jgi:TPR repeat protein